MEFGVIQIVDIALGHTDPSACADGATNNLSIGVTLIIQAVNNAIKHGRARQIAIHLSADEQQGSLTIRDDGCGIGDTAPRGACQARSTARMTAPAQPVGRAEAGCHR